MVKLRVLVADDHAACIESIRAVLPPQFQVIATVRSSDCRALSRTALKLRPDVILIRFETATPGGFQAVKEQAVKEIFQYLPHARIVFYANTDELDLHNAKTSSGLVSALEASGFMTKKVPAYAASSPPTSALKPKGNITLDPGSRSFPAREPDSVPAAHEVTDREYEVLGLLAAGYPMKRIAHRLGITYRTVTFHKYRMMERLGITTNAGLMTYAVKRNMGDRARQEESAGAA